jgi:hypothetical protein
MSTPNPGSNKEHTNLKVLSFNVWSVITFMTTTPVIDNQGFSFYFERSPSENKRYCRVPLSSGLRCRLPPGTVDIQRLRTCAGYRFA